jgi:ATP-dependent DNA ligase
MNKIGEIDKVNFQELNAERFWSFPKSYKKDTKEETRNMIFSGEYTGSRKMDGAYYRFIKDMNGNMVLQGRSKGVSGNFLDKYDWVPQLHPFFESLPNGTCLLGEIYFPENEGSSNVTKIMGCLMQKARERQEKGDKLHYYIFDVWAFNGESFLEKKIEDRINTLIDIEAEYVSEYVEVAAYFEGNELWEQLQLILENGGEGVVITKKGTIPEPGKRKARKSLKIKKEISNTIDCFFTGKGTEPTKEYTGKELETWPYYINTITDERLEVKEHYREYMTGSPIIPVTKPYYYGWAGSLEIGVIKGDKVVPIGLLSGLSDDLKSRPAAQKGKTIEVSCMELQCHDDGRQPGLRHAKFIQFRPDKDWKECKWEDVFGND